LEKAVALHSEEQLQSLAGDTRAEPFVRAWADVRLGELLYNKSQQPEYFTDEAARTELLNQAIKAHQEALRIGARWREIVGQATIGLGLCYENLAQYDLAKAQYDSIISQAKDRFAGTIWLATAESRKAFLAKIPEEKIVFSP
jgi:tetratricopeptide (TPR) repeat protein